MGIQMDVWKTRDDLPLFRDRRQNRPAPTTEPQAAKPAPKAAPCKSSDLGNPMPETAKSEATGAPGEDKGQVKTGGEDVAKLKNTCRNLLFFTSEVMAMPFAQPLSR
eukprot:4927893-Lingulodinium_polyedra.AAC.1